MIVRRETVGGQIVAHLRRDILFGRIPAGEILSQDAMCQRYQTSRMPVRDALRQLAHEGFLERLPGNRLRVSKLDRTDLLDMFWIEATVHALVTKRATERHRDHPEAFDELFSMQAEMKACAERSDFRRASAINRSFHRAINYMADSPKLMSTLRNVSLGIQGDFIAEVPEWLSRSIEEHEEIIEAMRRGDGDKARELMFLHTEGSAIKITNDLVGRGPEAEPDESDLRGFQAALSTIFEGWVEDAPISYAPLRTDLVP
ncbi:MAG TPA: GntR family transcriptional regulator [Acidimicrobiales bacterium]|nr:GntR family transcriptional regulator [Acidimicrobiales bacterium]